MERLTYNDGNFAVCCNEGRCHECNEKDIDEHFWNGMKTEVIIAYLKERSCCIQYSDEEMSGKKRRIK